MSDRTCAYESCQKPSRYWGHCPGHAAQIKRGKPLSPLGTYRDVTIRDSEGRKRCPTCTIWKPTDEFYTSSRTTDRLANQCKRCDRSNGLKKRFGITIDQYESMLASQGGVCAICAGGPGRFKSFSVDHDHACCPGIDSCGSCVRSLLCERCNMVLGLFNDSDERFEAAARYIRSHRVPAPVT